MSTVNERRVRAISKARARRARITQLAEWLDKCQLELDAELEEMTAEWRAAEAVLARPWWRFW